MEISVSDALLRLGDKDAPTAYKALLELERISDETGEIYPLTREFADMVADERYAMRVRGFRLFCKQAKWDVDNKLDESIDAALSILDDPKPTAVRQALAALGDVMRYKPDLRPVVADAALNIDVVKYADSMRGLIMKDIQGLLKQAEE
ncbi:MAG: hypothetical protein Q4D04_15425 [Clostridia bacterium]|nr:hypothetical protein [Clostridia bacterium]